MPASSDAYLMTARINELAEQIEQICVFVLTDGISGLTGSSPDFSYWVGFRATMTCATAEPVKRMAVVG